MIVDCVEAAPEINGPPRMLAGMAGRVSSPVLVGRRGELEQLIGAIDRTASGETNHVLIAGEAGVGKTRTTAEAAEQARRRGFRVLTGHCVSVGGSGLPYGPLVEALRDLAGSMDPVDLRAVAGPAATDLARLVPGFASGGAAAPAQSEWVQARLFEALLGLLGRLTERSPVLLVVEDLHWADPATLETISFLVHSLESVPFLLLATYRSDELHRRHPLLPWLAELERSGRVERLELDRLDRPAILALVRGILDTDPPPDLVGEIFERSDGNPFFAEELVAACRDDDVLRLPSTLREILVAHVGRLPDSAAAVLRVAAVAGRRVEHDLLASVAGLPGRELDDGLRAAVMGHVLVVEADGDDERYAFRHALVQEVVYDELLPGERRRLHRALAEALEADGAGAHDSEAGHWAELAHHWAQAHEERKAFEASLRAAAAAGRSFAFRAALHEYERALELWDGIEDAPDVAGFDRIELLRQAGQAAYYAADYHRALAHRKAAAEAADPTADPLRAGMLREELGRAHWVAGEPLPALESYHAAVATIPAEPPTAERARAVSGLGQILMLRSRYGEARAFCEEAIAIARSVGARAQEGHALSSLGMSLASLGDPAGPDRVREAIAIAREVENPDDIGRGYVNLAESLDEIGETLEAQAVTREGIEVAEELGIGPLYGYYLRLGGVMYAYFLGRWDEARSMLDDASSRGPAGRGPEVYRLSRALPVLVNEGSFGAADPGLARALALIGDHTDAQFVGPIHAAAAERELWRGNPEAALRFAETGLERLAATDEHSEAIELVRIGSRAAADLGEAARAARDDARLADARARLTAIRTHLERFADRRQAPGLRHLLDVTALGVDAEARRLDGTDDVPTWHAVAEQWDAHLRPYLAAYARWRAGEAAIRGGDRATAAEALRAAHTVAAELRAAPMREAVESLARRARIQLEATSTSGAAAPAGDPYGLTSREREVLTLLVEGRSNRQIAETLFIAESTAGVHVSNILGKLGVATRGEAAAVAFRLRLVPNELGASA